jgi:hypothetical protein
MRPFIADFATRRAHVRRYLKIVVRAEREGRAGPIRPADAQRLNVLRAGTFLILYNLVEASARAIVEAIHDEIVSSKTEFADLRDSLRKEVVRGFKRSGDADLHYTMVHLPTEFVWASLDVERMFSGNVDARLIRNIAEVYGFDAETPRSRTYGGSDLLTIKNLRNDLAHGVKTFDDVGREYPAQQLVGITSRSVAYMEAILKNVSDFLDHAGYRVFLPPMSPMPPT